MDPSWYARCSQTSHRGCLLLNGNGAGPKPPTGGRSYRRPQRLYIYNEPKPLSLPNFPLFRRLASHGVVLSVALGAAAMASPSLFEFSSAPFSPPSLPDWPALVRTVAPVESITIDPGKLDVAVDAATPSDSPKPEPAKTIVTVAGNLQKQTAPVTEAAAPAPEKKKDGSRDTIQQYTIQSGDTLSGIAEKFGLTTQSVIWANTFDNPNALPLGINIKVPPVSGVLHVVKSGDTLASIADRYKVEMSDIVGFRANKLADPNALVLSQEIMVPHGVKPIDALPATRLASTSPATTSAPGPAQPVPAQPQAGGALQWPTYGPIFTFFSGGHRGLDISPPYGTPVYAAESGVVIEATTAYQYWAYGTTIIIDHGNGLQTQYSHLSALLVSPGQRVNRGDAVGRVGTTGVATGPHLHFEVHQSGAAINPLNFLPR